MRVHIDRDKCVGHAQCFALDPDLFPIDDDGYSILQPHEVEPNNQSRIRRGAAACPETAFVIDES